MNRDMPMFSKASPGEQPHQQLTPDGEYIRQLEDKALAAGPLQVQTLEEPALLAKTAQCGRRLDETLVAFVGRIGLGPRPLREWTLERLSAWVAQREAAALEMESEPKLSF